MGSLFVVSAPSGAGKTTLCLRVRQRILDLRYSISYTTRAPRVGEVDGRDYFFVSQDRFRSMIDQGAFLEWAEVFGRYYGTGRVWIEEQLSSGRDVLVDVDVEGARQIKSNFPQAVFIFILPPTFDELTRRLTGRHTETEDQMRIRLERAREEIGFRTMYDYLVVNDEIERAVGDLVTVIRAEGLRLDVGDRFWDAFFDG